jgi:hypothetical protein
MSNTDQDRSRVTMGEFLFCIRVQASENEILAWGLCSYPSSGQKLPELPEMPP